MDNRARGGFLRFLVATASFVVIVAGMKTAAPLLVPFLLALFLTIILAPLHFSMMKRGLPQWLSLLSLIVGFALVMGTTVSLGGRALVGFLGDLPSYQSGLQTSLQHAVEWLRTKGVSAPESFISDLINPQAIISLLGSTAGTLRDMLSNAFMIFLIVVFMLLETVLLPDRIRQIPTIDENSLGRLRMVTEKVRNYMALKTMTSLLTGLLVMILLLVAGTRNALLMGMLAFLLNYIPNVGSIMASIPGILMTLVERSPGWALAVAIGYMIINIAIGNGLEPRFMGRGLGISPVIILLSMIFWAWVLGPVGMLLSVPLTMVIKIALEGFTETRGIAILMGPPTITPDSAPPPESKPPPEEPKP